MPLFMDIHHNVEGMTREKLVEAHVKDVEVQGKHGVKFVDYWYSENEGKIFCLCNAPNLEAAKATDCCDKPGKEGLFRDVAQLFVDDNGHRQAADQACNLLGGLRRVGDRHDVGDRFCAEPDPLCS